MSNNNDKSMSIAEWSWQYVYGPDKGKIKPSDEEFYAEWDEWYTRTILNRVRLDDSNYGPSEDFNNQENK